jgi:hypothetical protein
MSAARQRGHSPRAFLAARCGQSTVEVVGLLPILLAAGLGAYSLFSAGAAEHAADGAAEAGAVALLQGRDARAAARSALEDWPARRTRIAVDGRRVTITVTPSGPLGARLRARATADAGPAPFAAERPGPGGPRP